MSSYQVLARKYRPQQFGEVVGQDHIVRTLENAITQKRIAHAYLFVGPRGTGKTTITRILAKALNCSGSKEPTIKPCDECSNCREIIAGNSMDVVEIDGASNRGIDDVRGIRETVQYVAAKARFKVIYIDEVHMLTTDAFNALLKTLEEPPPHVKFLFATTDVQKMPLTILSRCQRFDVRRIPLDLIVQQLRKIAALEKVGISDAGLLAIARGAQGGLRDAESALDQIVAFCGEKVEEADVLTIFGLAAQEQKSRLTKGILAGDRAEVLGLCGTLFSEGKDLSALLRELIGHFRNMLVLQAGAQPAETTVEELSELQQHAKLIHRARTLRILEILTEAEAQMRLALSKRILLEVTLLKAIETKDEVLLEEVLKRLKGVESARSGGRTEPVDAGKRETPVTPSPSVEPRVSTSVSPIKPQKTAATAAVAAMPQSSPMDAALGDLWKNLIEHLDKTMPGLKSSVMEGRPLSMEGDTLLIGFDPEFKFKKELVDTSKSREQIQSVLRELTHRPIRVKVVFADDPSIPQGDEVVAPNAGAVAPSADVEAAAKRFEDDPLIHKALEIFKGQIVEIRR